MPITRLYTTVLLPTELLPDCIPLFCSQHANYQIVYYCSATHMPITRLYTTVLYQHAHYQTVNYWTATNRPITRLYTTVLLPTELLPDCILVGNQQAHDCIPLFCSQHAHYQTVYYSSATNMPITRLYSNVLLRAGPLPDCILLFCYQQTHNQTVNCCSATNRPITRLYTTVLLPTCPLPDCILLFCTNMPITRL